MRRHVLATRLGTKRGPSTRMVVESSLIMTWSEGPAVSSSSPAWDREDDDDDDDDGDGAVTLDRDEARSSRAAETKIDEQRTLNGSPTVSPVTAALCASEFLPPKWPSSTYLE